MKNATKNQGTNSVPKTTEKVNTVERLINVDAESIKPQERLDFCKNHNCECTFKNGKLVFIPKQKVVHHADTEKTKKAKRSKAKKQDTESINPFQKAITDFERMYIENNFIIPMNDETLYTLAKAIAYSVIKKLIQVSADITMSRMRTEMTMNFALLDNVTYYTANGTKAKYDKNGNIKLEITDKEYTKAIEKTLADTMSQGVDIVNQAVILVLMELDTIREKLNGKSFKIGFMTTPYESRKTNGKTFIIDGKKQVEWETVEITPIVNIFKGVRQYIQSNKSIKALVNGYSYIESYSIDSESDNIEKIYYRLQKYADLGGTAYDFNGKEIAYTTTESDYRQYKKLLADLIDKGNLSQKHIDFIQCRISGKSLMGTANHLGISLSTVERIQKDLQTKSVAVGYGTAEMLPKAENQSKAKPIIAIDENGKKYTFDSVKSASIKLAIDKSNITAVLKGRLKTTKGYKFEYAE